MLKNLRTYYDMRELGGDLEARASSGSYTPLEIARLYGFPLTYDGTGQKIGIIQLGGGYVLSDITTYLSRLGIEKTLDITSVSVDGATNNPADNSGATFEVILDMEIIAAIAPGSQIRVYFAPNSFNSFYNAISRAITDNCNIISISWGAPEVYWSSTNLIRYNTLFQTAAEKGITIFCAAGDNGSTDGTGSINVDFPGSSPYVVSCGGTTITVDNNVITNEIVWNNNPTTSATGGGISKYFSKPSYQNNVGLLQNITKRGLPDVSGNADPYTGYIIYFGGQYYVIGGTSAVSPLWSGLIALINQMTGRITGFFQPSLYSYMPSLLSDITSGNNGDYHGLTGWDFCTGWGSPSIQMIEYMSLSPRADFSYTQRPGTFTIVFSDSSNITDPLSYRWNFGNGMTSDNTSPTITFSAPGTYSVSLTIQNTHGQDVITKTVVVNRVIAPSSRFTGLTVQFRDWSVNNPTSWLWNFGDGTTSTLQHPVKTYSRSGTYKVVLTSRNSGGATTSSKSFTI